MDFPRTDPTTRRVRRHRTALTRSSLSRPVRLALEAGVLRPGRTVLDYGCGRGHDVAELRKSGYDCEGWDPSLRPNGVLRSSDVVNLGYVVNVIEDAREREAVLHRAWNHAAGVLVVSAQMVFDAKRDRGTTFRDGCLSSRDTFQKYFTQNELRAWIDTTLTVQSVPAAPGVFFVFRDPAERQSILAARYRRRGAVPKKRRSDELFEQHALLLEPLMQFVTDRGRLPETWELATAPAVCDVFGSLPRAFRVVRRVTGDEQWEAIRAERSQDLLLHLALERFGGRPPFRSLPPDLRLDVREFFGPYTKACDEADRLLFAAGDPERVAEACRSSSVGKQTPSALYVHVSARDELPHLLRVFEGCARAYIGSLEAANLVKLHRDRPRVSYLCYPTFDREAHPALLGSLLVDLQRLTVEYRDYADSENPPILHRKEQFVGRDHALRSRFATLTAQEERRGLYQDVSAIGTRKGWEARLAEASVTIRGHRVVAARRSAEVPEASAGTSAAASENDEDASEPTPPPPSPGLE